MMTETTNAQPGIVRDPKALETVDATIEWTHEREGHYYGEGTAALMRDIRDAILSWQEAAKGAAITPPQLRKLVATVLRKHCKLHGQKPEMEVSSRPASATGFVGAGSEYAGWEAGPYEWAIQTAGIINLLCPGILAEPYYSFDLCFTEG